MAKKFKTYKKSINSEKMSPTFIPPSLQLPSSEVTTVPNFFFFLHLLPAAVS